MNLFTWLKLIIIVSFIIIILVLGFDKQFNVTLYNLTVQIIGSRNARHLKHFLKNYWSIPILILLFLLWLFFWS